MSTTHLDLHLEHWGPTTDAPRALLLHGITSSAATMWRLGEGLAEHGWSVTAPDLRGHGHSPRAGSYRRSELAGDVLALGTGWDLVVGHSLGGAVTVAALAQDPGFAKRVVLLDPALRVPTDTVDDLAREMVDEVAQADAGAYRAAHPSWHPRTVQARVQAHQSVAPEAITAILTADLPWDHTEQAAGLTVPVHVIAADPDLDPSFTAAYGRELQQRNPGWTWEIAPGASHSVHRDSPDLVLERLLG
jgi:pimeloyl-ACP methyl ester carboxylesterase